MILHKNFIAVMQKIGTAFRQMHPYGKRFLKLGLLFSAALLLLAVLVPLRESATLEASYYFRYLSDSLAETGQAMILVSFLCAMMIDVVLKTYSKKR